MLTHNFARIMLKVCRNRTLRATNVFEIVWVFPAAHLANLLFLIAYFAPIASLAPVAATALAVAVAVKMTQMVTI